LGWQQDKIAQKRENLLNDYKELVKDIHLLREQGKKEDGNLAIKCNWNDSDYKAVCSDKLYQFNKKHGGLWCKSLACKCRKYANIEVTLDDNPCYESVALKEWRFGAGWDHNIKTGVALRPRHIKNIRDGRLAILSSVLPHHTEESERFIIALIFINKICDDPGKETIFFGDPEKSIKIDYQKHKLRFWDYYENPRKPKEVIWASGLYRYITNRCVLKMLRDIVNKQVLPKNDLEKAEILIDYLDRLEKDKTPSPE